MIYFFLILNFTLLCKRFTRRVQNPVQIDRQFSIAVRDNDNK